MNSSEAVTGTRVVITSNPNKLPYIRKRQRYLNLQLGMVGTVIKTNGHKLGIQFDNIIWTGYNYKESSFDNGCHGYGELHKCTYLDATYVEPIIDNDSHPISLSMYMKHKKVILFDNESDIEEFISDKKKNSHGNDLTSHYFVGGDESHEKNLNTFINRQVSNYGHMFLITGFKYHYITSDAFPNLKEENKSIKDYPAYKWDKESKWDGYVMRNVKLQHNPLSCLSSFDYNRYEQPKTRIIITSNNNASSEAYAVENGLHFIHGKLDLTEVSDHISNLAKEGGDVLITRYHAKQLDFKMLNAEYCVLYLQSDDETTLMCSYGDDLEKALTQLHEKTMLSDKYSNRDKLEKEMKELHEKSLLHNNPKPKRLYVVSKMSHVRLVSDLEGGDNYTTFFGNASFKNMFTIEKFNREGGVLVTTTNKFTRGGIRWDKDVKVIVLDFNNSLKTNKTIANICYGKGLVSKTIPVIDVNGNDEIPFLPKQLITPEGSKPCCEIPLTDTVIGTASIWYGDPNTSLPDGWVICDGNNGTRDLVGGVERDGKKSEIIPIQFIGIDATNRIVQQSGRAKRDDLIPIVPLSPPEFNLGYFDFVYVWGDETEFQEMLETGLIEF